MNIKHIMTIAATAAVLSACVGKADKPQTVAAPQAENQQAVAAEKITFKCKNSMTVVTQYLADANDNQRIGLQVDVMEANAVLPQVVSGSGERYQGQGFYGHETEWHQKGGEAHFTFRDAQGNKVETACNQI